MVTASGGSRRYDIGPDGRFVIIRDQAERGGPTTKQIVLAQNWFEELKRVVPAGRR
jgi:hypothetical protein